MPEERTFLLDESAEGQRLDKWLSCTDMELTRTAVQSLMEKGAVTVNGKAVSKNYKCKKGDNVTVVIPEPEILSAEPEDIPLAVKASETDKNGNEIRNWEIVEGSYKNLLLDCAGIPHK